MIAIKTDCDNKALERAEIIAALRCCSPYPTSRGCGNCPVAKRDTWCCSKVLGSAVILLEQDTAPNDPLTLEELRGMDGAFVWAVAEDEPEAAPVKIDAEKGWAKPVNIEPLEFDNYGHGTDDYYGWLAYRRKPGGGGEQ